MGMDLVRRRDSKKWTCNNSLWRFILEDAMKEGWVPRGTEYKSINKDNHDPEDYYSNAGQTVTPSDAEEIYKCLNDYAIRHELQGIEKEIIHSFLEWLIRRDDTNSIIDIPGFIIR
jgi:hypothetical protein